jgi:hypothetical protein
MRLFYLFCSAALCAASTVTFSPVPGEGPAVPVTVEVTDTIGGVEIRATVSGPLIGDLRGLFFQLSGALPSCSEVEGGTDCQVSSPAAVVDLGGGANMAGTGMHYELGIEIGTLGIGQDDIQAALITITNGSIRASDFIGVGVRLTSVGEAGGNRFDSSKLIDTTPETQVPEPATWLMIGGGLVFFGLRPR